MTTLWVAIGGAIGSVARYWVAVLVARATGPDFPWGTILINISGSFVIGFFFAVTAEAVGRWPVASDVRIFVMAGLCGGFTTFSAFSLQTLVLMRDGRMTAALANIALSVVLCLAAVAIGYAGGDQLNAGASLQSSDR
jgi:CrcB protein